MSEELKVSESSKFHFVVGTTLADGTLVEYQINSVPNAERARESFKEEFAKKYPSLALDALELTVRYA